MVKVLVKNPSSMEHRVRTSSSLVSSHALYISPRFHVKITFFLSFIHSFIHLYRLYISPSIILLLLLLLAFPFSAAMYMCVHIYSSSPLSSSYSTLDGHGSVSVPPKNTGNFSSSISSNNLFRVLLLLSTSILDLVRESSIVATTCQIMLKMDGAFTINIL